ncbi:hypothetical protein ABMA70_06530 [Halobacteriovorax sp. XZX-3]|uniref:hypothetical protein n=1 Tax=unclassified Halobacteriovorax TaxID=2639665 RepID=UPI000CD04724|nr:hypothetical protein [Halobacteriovorax sp. DA5]POB14850.1 hypothetical protein C0Z22_00320 [Halobacteriovorax sp. DA5]
MSKVLFSGKIKVKGAGADVVYKFDTQEPTFDEVMMTNFTHLNFSENEKRLLTAKNRKDIFKFENLNTKELERYAGDLLSLIKKVKSDRIQIETCNAGTFICLALIYSGKIPSHLDVHFKLHGSPLRLFPRILAKHKIPKHNISISLCNTDSWVQEFRSLQMKPKYIELSHIAPQEDLDLVG